MLQALARKGRVLPEDVPAPAVSPGSVLIKVVNSCISAGTELTSVASSGKSLIRRALEQPAALQNLIDKARNEGLHKALAKVKGKLVAGAPLGYSLSGIVIAVGEGVTDLRPGDRVAAAGAGVANHAEYVDVPRNLVVLMPDAVDFAPASTVALGAIAMQGVRRANLAIGEFAVVLGVGAIGQIAVQVLRAAGVRVIALDLDDRRLDHASSLGAELTINTRSEDAVKLVHHYTGGKGADAVLFCAATSQSEVLSNAFAMTRRKGKVVMVGVWGAELRRGDIYKKELDFLISTSYGPGRYDADYEEKGQDYPYAYVRWTENRNMAEYLRLLATKEVNLAPLIEVVYPIGEAEAAFAALANENRPLIVLLDYGVALPVELSPISRKQRCFNLRSPGIGTSRTGKIRVGVVGAGSFAVGMHLPNLQKLDAFEIRAICSRTGSKAKAVAQQFDAAYATTDYEEILNDGEIDLILISTRHNLHGPMVLDALRAGKNTFVEKPLCLHDSELEQILSVFRAGSITVDRREAPPLLMVGFNRRFAPCIQEVKRLTERRINPLFLHYRMNAGYVPLEHWVHDPEQGGGRIVGEACHIIDLFSFLVGAPVRTYTVAGLRPATDSVSESDNKVITLEYEDGSVGTLHYFAVGPKTLPKERLEVFWDEKAIVMEDYTSLVAWGTDVSWHKSWRGDKGHLHELIAISEVLAGSNTIGWPISLESVFETTKITFDVQ